MAIDLNVIANVYNQKEQNRKESQQKATESLIKFHNAEEQKEQAAVSQESNDVASLVKSLNINSTVDDFAQAEIANDNWLRNANEIAKTDNDKKLNQAIWETKNLLINEVQDSAADYMFQTNKINTTWNKIQELQTEVEDYDFTAVKEALDSYKKTGEKILTFNNNWVHKENYKQNLNALENWLDTGMELEALDTDKEVEGIQTLEDFPAYDAILNRAYQSWKLGNAANAQSALDKSLSFLTGSYEAQMESEAATAERDKEYALEFMKMQGEDRIAALQDYSNKMLEYQYELAQGNEDAEKPEEPFNYGAAEQMIVQGFMSNDPDFQNQLKLNKDKYNKNVETYAYSAINAVKNALGQGTGVDGLEFDDKLKDKLSGIGLYSTAKGSLDDPKSRKVAVNDITLNIKEVFDYLEGFEFGQDFSDESGYIRKILDGSIVRGSQEWYIAMDSILNEYLPKQQGTGVRLESQDAKDKTVGNFGSNSGNIFFDDDAEEANGYEVLMRLLRAYDAVRAIDRRQAAQGVAKDPANPLNIKL
jgi:hypothetical protein